MIVPAHVQARIQRFDKRLRLRPGHETYAVEYQGPDGRYTRIGEIRPDILGDGSGILAILARSDVQRRFGSGNKAADHLERQERDATQQRQQRRKDNLVDQARESYDQLARMQGRRINNAGSPTRPEHRPEPTFIAGPAVDRDFT